MNWAWMGSLDQAWRSPAFPMWMTLAAAGFFAIVVLVTLWRAEKSIANGALTVITLLAVGIAVAASMRGFGTSGPSEARQMASAPAMTASLPALACIDDLAGETVLGACEKIIFGGADAAAAAVSYAASQISRLVGYGDVAAANKNFTPELMALRRSVERDRYGLIAFVLRTRDRCQPGDCAAYASLTDHNQIAANMEERIYDGLIARYAAGWNTPVAPATLASLPPSVPTGKPTNAEFPTAASIPPVNIMTPEPVVAPPRTVAAPAATTPRPAAAAAPSAASSPAAPNKPAVPKPAAKPRPPVQAQTGPARLAPAAPAADN